MFRIFRLIRAARVLLSNLIRLIQLILGKLEHPLPITKDDLSKLSTKVFRVYKLPDDLATRHSVATAVMQAKDYRASLHYFGNAVHKGMATANAYNVIRDLAAEEQRQIVASGATTLKDVT